MQWLIAPENDYSSLRPSTSQTLKVAVVIPVYNRVDLLVRTVAGLVPQTYPGDLTQVVVADDGSTESVPAALEQFADELDLVIVRRERDGYGAGQARNLGAEGTTADVLVFIDADCVPHPDLVARHAAWHHAADNLVVIGARHGLDTSGLTVGDLASGTVDLPHLAGGVTGQTDHRRVLHRRTADQRHGDEAFRSLVSSNFSIRRDRFDEVGGFASDFHRWGGEDIELGWRLFNQGMFTVPEDDAIAYHQLQEDAWGSDGRAESRQMNEGIIRSRIPHRFYRPSTDERVHEVPKVSFVVKPSDTDTTDIEVQISRQRFVDWEAIVPVLHDQHDTFVERTRGDSRFGAVLGTVEDALRATRGEYVAVVDSAASLDPDLLDRCLARLERSPRIGRLTVGYQTYGAASRQYRHGRAAGDLDDLWSGPPPVFSMVRRREWAKALHGSTSVAEAWTHVVELTRGAHLAEALVALPDDPTHTGLPQPFVQSDRSMLAARIQRAGSNRDLVRALGAFVLTRTRRSSVAKPPRDRSASTETPVARYVGWTGHDNLGDEAMLRATTSLMPWATVATKGPGRVLLLGGGTLINRSNYLHWLAEQDSPRIERATFGTGVANPEYWGLREDPKEWAAFLESCCVVGVRGPISQKIVGDWGVRREVRVIGDPALALVAPDVGDRDPSHVVIAPAWTAGELWGDDDGRVFEALAETTRELLSAGRRVTLLSCHPSDDRPCLEIMRAAGSPNLPYLAGYREMDATLGLLASAGVVVGERLHACVLAAAGSTPFVAIEYRPKLRDFAASVDWDKHVIRTDKVTRNRLLSAIESAETSNLAPLVTAVAEYRRRLAAASEDIREAMG